MLKQDLAPLCPVEMASIVQSDVDFFRKHPLMPSVGPYRSTNARVMYLRRTTTSLGRGCQGVLVTIFNAFSFQRLPSTFCRTERASTAPISRPMTCSSLRSDFPSQIAVRQRSSSFVRSAVLGSLYHVASQNIEMPASCVFASFESGVSRYFVGSHSVTAQDSIHNVWPTRATAVIRS